MNDRSAGSHGLAVLSVMSQGNGSKKNQVQVYNSLAAKEKQGQKEGHSFVKITKLAIKSLACDVNIWNLKFI